MDLRPEFTTLRACAVAVEEGRMLLCRLGSNSNDPGLWTLPGGGGEYGESPEETCHREMDEETGLQVELQPYPLVNAKLWENRDSRVHNVRFLYRAKIVGGTIRNEVDGSTDLVQWVPLDEVPQLWRADIVMLAEGMLTP